MTKSNASMVGKRYGRWTVIRRCDQVNGATSQYFACLCDCGKQGNVFVTSLKKGKSTSCGCYRIEVQRRLHTIHGHADQRNQNTTRAYYAWVNMKTRCHNPRSQDWVSYGGRGIQVCDAWKDSFEAFLKDMGEPPSGMTLDRERVNEDYHPNNCRWATNKIQSRNRRNTIKGIFRGGEIALADAVELHGCVTYRTAIGRLKLGWSFEDAVLKPLQRQARSYAPPRIYRTKR